MKRWTLLSVFSGFLVTSATLEHPPVALAQTNTSVDVFGSVRRGDGSVLSGAVISALNGSIAPAALNSNGNYTLTVPADFRQQAPYVVLKFAAAGFVTDYAIAGLPPERGNQRVDMTLQTETPITYTANFTGAFGSYTEPTIGCAFTTSITAGTITLQPTANPDGTLQGTAAVSISHRTVPASYTVPGGSCTDASGATSLSGTISGTDSNLTVSDLTNGAADRPYTATFSGTRSASGISGSLSISRAFQTLYNGSVTGTFPRTASAGVTLNGDKPVFTLQVELDPNLKTLDGVPYIEPYLPDAGPRPEDKTSLKLTAKKDGQLIPLNFTFDIKADPYSNGHKHMSSPAPLGATAPQAFPVLGVTTGSGGTFQTSLIAGEAAVDLTIIARATPSANSGVGMTQTVVSAPIQLRIGIPNLVPIGKVAKGQTPNAADYDISAITSHTEGFYGTSATNDFLADAISVLKEMRVSGVLSCDSAKLVPLRISGVSLRYGGLFDIDSDFLAPHKEHRSGREVDIPVDPNTYSADCQSMLEWGLEGAKFNLSSSVALFRVRGEKPGDFKNHWHVEVPLPETQNVTQFGLTPTSLSKNTLESPNVFALTQQAASTTVTQSGSGQTATFVYGYSVANPNSSKSLRLLKVASTGTITSPQAPGGWIHGPWARSGGWFWGGVGTAVISPGSQKTGFALASASPPAIQRSLVDFVYNDPVFSDETVALDPSLLHADESVSGFVLAPRNAATFQAQPFLADVIQMKSQAVTLGWIDNAGMAGVDARLSAANAALLAGSTADAYRALLEARLEIEGKKSYLREEGYALLALNVQYLLDRLPVPDNPVPALSSISPDSAPAGSDALTITLTGTNFVPNSVARIGAAVIATTYANPARLTAVIPASSLAAAGSLSISVLNPPPAGGVSQNAAFTVQPVIPAITAISPTSGNAGQSVSATITGTNLATATGVVFSGTGVTATIGNASSTSISVTISISAEAALGTRTMTVTSPGGNSGAFSGFTVLGPLSPIINELTASPPGLSQALAPHYGGPFTMTVNGSNFINGAIVLVANTTASTTAFVSSSQLTAGVPASVLSTTGALAIQVRNPDGSASNTMDLRVVDRGDLNSNGLVNIGDALVGALTAGGVLKPPLPVSVGDINLSGAANIGDALSLALFAGRSFPNLATPVITSASPQPATRGSTLTLSGSGFSATAANNQVMFAVANNTFTRVTPATVSGAGSNMTMTVAVPANAAGGMIAVNRLDAAVGGAPYALEISGTTTPLVLTGVTPASPITPGSTIVLSGIGFDPSPGNNTVLFRASDGTVAGTVTAATSTSLTVVVPSDALCGGVTVTAGNKTSNARAAVISGSTCPVRILGLIGGGDPGDILVIDGTGFDLNPARNSVKFAAAGGGTVNAPVMMAGSTQLHIHIPETAIDGDLTVAAGGQTSTGYSYRPATPPLLASISPSRGPVGTSLTYTLTGANFRPGVTSISVAGTGIVVDNVNVASSTSITARLTIDGGAALGSRQLTVQTPGGSATGNLTIAAQPAITALNPASALQNTAISALTVSGSSFDLFTSPSVVFIPTGGSTADTKFQVTNITVVNASTITFGVQIGSSSNVVPAGNYRIEIRDNAAFPQIRTQIADIANVNLFEVAVPLQTVSVSSPILRVNSDHATAGLGSFSAASNVLQVINPAAVVNTPTAAASAVLIVTNPNVVDQLMLAGSTLTACFPPIALGTNLIVNPGADSDGAARDTATSLKPACWTITTPAFTAAQYGTAGFPQAPANAGANFFAGGPDAASSAASQTIDVSSLASSIDGGNLKATLSALLGGADTQSDSMTVSVTFKSGTSAVLGTFSIGPVSAPDRNNQTSFLSRSAIAAVPSQTRTIVVTLSATRSSGSYNDGYADNISLSLNF